MDLTTLIERLRSDEMDLDEFATTAAANYAFRKPLPYPETDGNEDVLFAPSSVTITGAVERGALTEAEAGAIYAALEKLRHQSPS